MEPSIQRSFGFFRRSPFICASCRTHLRRQHARARQTLHHKPQTTVVTTSGLTPSTTLHNFKRLFQTSTKTNENTTQQPKQAHPLGDFYADLIATPIPKTSQAKTDLPSWVDTHDGDETISQRAAQIFGTIKGSGYERRLAPEETWHTIHGVAIPPRPLEPENCCMSGCAHCVWDDYRDDIEEWAGRVKQAQAQASTNATGSKLRSSSEASDDMTPTTTPKLDMKRPEVDNASVSMDDDGGGSESLWQSASAGAQDDDLFAGIPVGIRAFMDAEKKIRERRKAKKIRDDEAYT